MKYREIARILKADQWALVRVCGSHHQFRKAGNPHTIVVPNHNGKDITVGVLKDLEKKTGLSFRR